MIMICSLESKLGVDKLWTEDQISPATFVDKSLKHIVCGSFEVTKADRDPVTYKV